MIKSFNRVRMACTWACVGGLEMLNVNGGRVFAKDAPVRWKCRNCGYVFEGTEAPTECPACKHPQAYYELFVEAY